MSNGHNLTSCSSEGSRKYGKNVFRINLVMCECLLLGIRTEIRVTERSQVPVALKWI
jgi:hypothetical protein